MSAIELGFGIALGFFLLPIIFYVCAFLIGLAFTFLGAIFNFFAGNKF